MNPFEIPGNVVKGVIRAISETYGFGEPRSPLPPNKVNQLIGNMLKEMEKGGRR